MAAVHIAAAAAVFVLVGSASQAASPGYHVVDRIAGPDGGWDYVSIDAVHGRALIARAAAVTAIDLKTRTVTPALAVAARGHAALAVNHGAEILITNGASDSVTFVDGRTGALVATVPTGGHPDAATQDERSGLVLVMDHTGGDVVLIDPKSHQAVASITVGGVLEAAAVDGKGRAFVNVEDKNQIAVIDIAARRVVARYALTGCDGPTGLVYADGLLVAACDGAVEVVAADTGKVLHSLPIGGGADGVAYDPGRHRVFIPAGRTGTLAVFSLARGDLEPLETVPTKVGARTIAFDPASGRLLLPTARYVTKDGKRTTAPGTFELLVVGQ